MKKIKRVGVDIAKSVFHVHGVDDAEQPVWQGKYSRAYFRSCLSNGFDRACRSAWRSSTIDPELSASSWSV